MSQTRRAALAALASLAAPAQQPEQIVMLVYPGMTALDLIGPQQVFGYMMGAKIHLVWKTKSPVVTDTGISLLPSMTFDECPAAPDILFVPGGGAQTIQLMDDETVLAFLAARGKAAKLITSVCSGALVLGAAGLLKGYKATTHWAVHDVLPLLGATPVQARVVEDRNRITAGGITSGIDFALRIAALLQDSDVDKAGKMMSGCMSGPSTPACAPLFSNLGLPFPNQPTKPQTFFRSKGTAQP